VNDDEYSLFMALRISYCYVQRVEQNAYTSLNPFFNLPEASEVLNKYVI